MQLMDFDGALDFKVSVWDIAAVYALIGAVGGEFHFIERDIFPMTRFHVNHEKTPFYAGSPVFCRYVEQLIKAD